MTKPRDYKSRCVCLYPYDNVLNYLPNDIVGIPYIKRYLPFTKTVNSTILFQQIYYRAFKKGFMPFYKFTCNNNHPLCTKKDTWVEELGFTKHQFISARNNIATKITKGKRKNYLTSVIDPKHIVLYWTDSQRITWYEINLPVLDVILGNINNLDEVIGKQIPDGTYEKSFVSRKFFNEEYLGNTDEY